MFANTTSYLSLETAYPPVTVTLPKSSLGYKTNTNYPEFPPMMSDGRSLVSSWQPESKLNEDLINSNRIKNNWEYRQYLTKNADDIMKSNFVETANDTGYSIPPVSSGDKNSPYTFSSFQDTAQPQGYVDSDLKQLYLTREQLNARKVAPVVQGMNANIMPTMSTFRPM